jgi:carbon starvation protein
MLAAVALMLGTVVLFKMKRERFAWVAILPTIWLLACTLTAGWLKVFSSDVKVGFLANADRYANALAQGQLLAPAKTQHAMEQIVFNNRLDAGLCLLFLFVVLTVLVYSVKACLQARAQNRATSNETPYHRLPDQALQGARG